MPKCRRANALWQYIILAHILRDQENEHPSCTLPN